MEILNSGKKYLEFYTVLYEDKQYNVRTVLCPVSFKWDDFEVTDIDGDGVTRELEQKIINRLDRKLTHGE